MLFSVPLTRLLKLLNKNHGQWDFDNLANFFNADDLVDWGFDMKEIKFSVPEINELSQNVF